MNQKQMVEGVDTLSMDVLPKIYFWMALGLMVSGLVALNLFRFYSIMGTLLSNNVALVAIAVLQLGFVVWLSLNIEKLSTQTVNTLFFVYAAFNGFSLGLLFQFFLQNSILSTFLILAGMFFIAGIIGFVFKNNALVPNLITLASVGLLLDVYINVFWRNDRFQLITSGIAVLIFVGIVAYDFKHILALSKGNTGNGDNQETPIIGAFAIYLNLYYLFIALILETNTGTKRINT
jgi:uncharacterized protein